MPTKYKPVLSEVESAWSGPAKMISDQVFQNRANILEALNFYDEHGRLGDAGGGFDQQLLQSEQEILSEIADYLTFAAAQAAEPRRGVLIATLEHLQKHPAGAQNRTLPGVVERLLADHYQRGEEEKGTHFPDVMGFLPGGIEDTIETPNEASISNAASAAIDDLKEGIVAGRPRSKANTIVAHGLGLIFLRYNEKITRRSETSWRDGEFIQVETGEFLTFVRAAIVPLANFLHERHLPRVTAESIVRQALPYFSHKAAL